MCPTSGSCGHRCGYCNRSGARYSVAPALGAEPATQAPSMRWRASHRGGGCRPTLQTSCSGRESTPHPRWCWRECASAWLARTRARRRHSSSSTIRTFPWSSGGVLPVLWRQSKSGNGGVVWARAGMAVCLQNDRARERSVACPRRCIPNPATWLVWSCPPVRADQNEPPEFIYVGLSKMP
jgi:hypothetical protein